MLNQYWTNHTTFKHRYEATGIVERITSHLKMQKTNTPTIIDVGSSTGIALRTAVTLIKRIGVSPYTVGIDSGKKVRSKAERNLDEFINSDVLTVEHKEQTADIVICHKAAIFVTGPQRAAIIRKCSTLLKNDGILITDVDCFPKRTVKENVRRILLNVWYQIPTLGCLKHGLNEFEREYEIRVNKMIRKDVFQLTKEEAEEYSAKIEQGWNNRSKIWQSLWKFRIFTLFLLTTWG